MGCRAPADACPLCSGLTHEAHRKEVEQVYLRCSAGSVEWMYPTGALIVNVRPNTFPPSRRHLTLCIKPLRDSSGANIYLEKTGELQLLVRDGDRGPRQVHCFGFEQRGLFVEATPQQDISRRTTGFQYELTSRHAESDLRAQSGEWQPPGRGGQCSPPTVSVRTRLLLADGPPVRWALDVCGPVSVVGVLHVGKQRSLRRRV